MRTADETIVVLFFIPDIDQSDILSLIRSNFALNRVEEDKFHVTDLDFFDSNWKSRLDDRIRETEVLLVADVVYNPEITTKFFETLKHFLQVNPRLVTYIAIEKRNRVVEDGRIAAPNFDHFRGLLDELMLKFSDFALERLELDFHQFFASYDRVKELHLWRLASK